MMVFSPVFLLTVMFDNPRPGWIIGTVIVPPVKPSIGECSLFSIVNVYVASLSVLSFALTTIGFSPSKDTNAGVVST